MECGWNQQLGTELSVERTRFYAPDDYPMLEKAKSAMGGIKVTRSTTFNAARELHKVYPDKKIAVLNFASATNPGGGVTRGSSAQLLLVFGRTESFIYL